MYLNLLYILQQNHSIKIQLNMIIVKKIKPLKNHTNRIEE